MAAMPVPENIMGKACNKRGMIYASAALSAMIGAYMPQCDFMITGTSYM